MMRFFSKKIETRHSRIGGLGVYATELIHKGEVICVKGGKIIKKEELSNLEILNSYMPINDEECIGPPKGEEVNLYKIPINHSCEPNVSIADNITFVAQSDVEKKIELTVDYAFIDNQSYRFICNCGNSDCRKIITGFDWQLKEVQQRYKKEYFSSYIQSKINAGINVDIKRGLDKQIKSLRKEVFVDTLQFKIEDEFDPDESKYIHCCLYEKNELVAYARVEIQNGIARVGRVAVRKDRRRNGYGRQIMFWAETEALKYNRNDVEIHALISAVDFYKKLGYVPAGEKFMEEDKPHVRMTKHLELDV